MDEHNKANNKSNSHSAFICIQQMTKGGDFAGSNRIKHMTTAMAHIKGLMVVVEMLCVTLSLLKTVVVM